MAELASRKKCAKAALIALAKQRFAEQQSASSHQLVAPISPSPPELIEKTLRELEARDRFLRRRDQEQRDSDHLGAYMTLLEARLETMERSARARQEQLLQGQKASKLQEQMMGLARGRSGAIVNRDACKSIEDV